MGIPYSPQLAYLLPVKQLQMVDKILSNEEGWKFLVLAPTARGKKESSKELTEIQNEGLFAYKLTENL